MTLVSVVPTTVKDPGVFADVLGEEAWGPAAARFAAARERLAGRTVWNVNTTAAGGGVAEMLHSLTAYAKGGGVDCRWAIISPPPGEEEFFAITKRIHNLLHGAAGDGEGLDQDDKACYERVLAANAAELCRLVKPGDLVVLHDPQTAGLIPAVLETGARVVWRCHVGLDNPNDYCRTAWDFLRGYVLQAEKRIFSRPQHIWEGIGPADVLIVPPCIDAFSPKNQELSAETVEAMLRTMGVIDGEPEVAPEFVRQDGTVAVVEREAEMFGVRKLAPAKPLITQVSRWDALKDPLGVMDGFVKYVLPLFPDAQLALVGPETAAVSDDPEGAQVLLDCQKAWQTYAAEVRARIALICLPMTDLEENAAMVNAIQRHSTIIVQKSLAEGFGLTVSEGMWKQKPLVAARAGGIADQIRDGESGLLIDDPRDLEAYGQALVSLLAEPTKAEAIGGAAKERVKETFLATRNLGQYADLLSALATFGAQPPATDEAEAA